jgi:hypothetical protein
MARAAWVMALVVTAVLLTRHVADVQPTARRFRAGASNSDKDKPAGRDPDPARMPPGKEEKALPQGQTGVLSNRADPFDAAFNLVEDEVST